MTEKKRYPTPEEFIQSGELDRVMRERVQEGIARLYDCRERSERRRRRLRRLSFGLLGRD
jgi:hypothetical protein